MLIMYNQYAQEACGVAPQTTKNKKQEDKLIVHYESLEPERKAASKPLLRLAGPRIYLHEKHDLKHTLPLLGKHPGVDCKTATTLGVLASCTTAHTRRFPRR